MFPYNKDLHGDLLKVCVCGYLRPEQNFTSVDDLIKAIEGDIRNAEDQLNLPQFLQYKNSEFFKMDANHNVGNGNGTVS